MHYRGIAVYRLLWSINSELMNDVMWTYLLCQVFQVAKRWVHETTPVNAASTGAIPACFHVVVRDLLICYPCFPDTEIILQKCRYGARLKIASKGLSECHFQLWAAGTPGNVCVASAFASSIVSHCGPRVSGEQWGRTLTTTIFLTTGSSPTLLGME